LFLWGNNLEGPIPSTIGNLTDLVFLTFWGSNLSGTLPAELGNLVNLEVLSLGNNQFTGAIPSQLTQLTHLVGKGQGPWGEDGLSLDYNRLNVPVPYPSNPPTALQNFLLANDPDWQLTQAVSSTISTGGGELTSRDNTSIVTVPAGAVASQLILEYLPQPWPQEGTGNLQYANSSFELNAVDQNGTPLDSFVFVKPVTVTIHYTDADAQDMKEEALHLYYWDTSSSTWKDAGSTCTPNSSYVRDLVNNTISVNICHLTEFALMGNSGYMVYLPTVVH
jgi:hypothetical protein